MSGAVHITEVLQRYAALMSAGDTDGIMSLYAPNARLRDPISGPEHIGQDAIRAWYQESFDNNGGAIEMRLEGAVRVAGKFGAAALTAIGGNGTLQVETLDVMGFDDDGLVVRMDAYRGPTNVTRIRRSGSGGSA
jgi:steroid delta-isomerase